ncbi:MAG: hypothetical protein E7390_04480 [Ruminococcaceae bacterium]|nr:hypothetical protein [Oscillospiraceae bacterium]
MTRDLFEAYMKKEPEIVFHDQAIEDFTLEALSGFKDGDAFAHSFDVTVKGKKEFEEVFILSTTAMYESENGAYPTAQVRVIDDAGDTLYFSPVYEIGHSREFYRREWRVPPTLDRYDTIRLSFIIPEGVKLFLRTIKIKHNYGYREKDIGIRYHGHGGITTVFGWQMTAEMGFTSCITIPKFTKDGIGVCVHDDNVRKELRLADGTMAAEGSKYDRNVWEFTYDELCELHAWRRRSDIFTGMRVPTMEEFFRICSSTGMQPIFSVHPALTREEWLYVRKLLVKYRLLEHFWVKTGNVETQKLCLEVFDDEIAGRILLFNTRDGMINPADVAREIGLDQKRHNVVVEYFYHTVTEEKIKQALAGGFPVSVAAMMGGVSGPRMQELIDLGVTEFTVDRHCSMGLSW